MNRKAWIIIIMIVDIVLLYNLRILVIAAGGTSRTLPSVRSSSTGQLSYIKKQGWSLQHPPTIHF